jgi:maleylpyruvate isomerase
VKPDDWIDGACEAHRRLLVTVARVDDTSARDASLLPGWSRGHVLTHLARNADSHIRIIRGAQAGATARQYPGGPQQRSADIEAGAGRSAADLVADVCDSCAALEAAWDATSEPVWTRGSGIGAGGAERSLPEWVFSRWREVEVHHADLGLGFAWSDLTVALVEEELRRAELAYDGPLPAEVAALAPHARLAWFAGRLGRADLPEAPPWP